MKQIFKIGLQFPTSDFKIMGPIHFGQKKSFDFLIEMGIKKFVILCWLWKKYFKNFSNWIFKVF